MTTPLVSSLWLQHNLSDPNLIILDVSPQPTAYIKGARYFDLKNEFSIQNSEFPNTFPSVAQFEKGCQQLGINKTSKIVVYDNKGVYLSPRVWWMFNTMGHQNVAVLDGGLPNWMAQGYETAPTTNQHVELGNFEANFQKEKVKDYGFIKSNTNEQKAVVIDARSAGRFNGTAPEPREGLRSGCIPNSINLPYTEVLEEGKFKAISELREIFKHLAQEEKPFVFSCGSGVTACIILLASEMAMQHSTAVYDGSWTEWAQLEN